MVNKSAANGRENASSQAEEVNNTDGPTEREVEREEEEKEYTSVIVKRVDEALKHPDDILEKVIHEGLEQQNRAFLSLLLSAMAAGLILGFTAMSVATAESQMLLLDTAISSRFVTALVYPLGFVLCIMSGTQLFTEHTATAVYPVLDGRGDFRKMLRLWAVVIAGNLLGAMISAVFLVLAEGVIQAEKGYLEIGKHLVAYTARPLFFSSLLAGWLMALGAWLVMSTGPALSQMVSIYIVTFIIGAGGLHHSIAGSVEIFTAYLLSDLFSPVQVLRFVGITIIGNLIGGAIFVALLNYGHIRHTQKTHEDHR